MESVALGALATTIVSSVLLPYLSKAGEAFSEKVGERLFELLKARFEKKPAAVAALQALEKEPQGTHQQQVVQQHVQDLLTRDPATLLELQSLLAEAQAQRVPGVAIQQNAGDNAKQFGQVIGNVSFGKDQDPT